MEQQSLFYEIFDGKELDESEFLNLSKAVRIVAEFYDVNSVAIVKDGKPCSVALGKSVYDAYLKAFDSDPINSCYGTYAFSKKVGLDCAKHLCSIFAQVVIAPDFEKDALELLKSKSKVKIVKLNTELEKFKEIEGSVPEKDLPELNKETFKVITKAKPTVEQIEDAVFGWKVAGHTEMTSALIVKDFSTAGIAQSSSDVTEAVEEVLNLASDNSKDAVLVVDCSIPVEDCIYAAVQNRVGLIIQTGGTVNDDKLIELCNKYEIAMITTGIKNYTN